MLEAQKRKRNGWISAAIIVVLIVLDQAVKVLARAHLMGRESYSYLNGFVKVEYAENRGAFLSLGAAMSEEARTAFFVFGASAMLLFCVYWLWKTLEHTFSAVAFALVIAGGVGNLIDRIFRGSVTDYVHMGFTSLRTGVFNVADVAISFGFVFLIFLQYQGDEKKS